MSHGPRRLTKRDVEAMWDRYDADPAAALTNALAIVLGASNATPWNVLLQLAHFEPNRRADLAERRTTALDELAAELSELRTLPGAGNPTCLASPLSEAPSADALTGSSQLDAEVRTRPADEGLSWDG